VRPAAAFVIFQSKGGLSIVSQNFRKLRFG
jgi:hypothetical protein